MGNLVRILRKVKGECIGVIMETDHPSLCRGQSCECHCAFSPGQNFIHKFVHMNIFASTGKASKLLEDLMRSVTSETQKWTLNAAAAWRARALDMVKLRKAQKRYRD